MDLSLPHRRKHVLFWGGALLSGIFIILIAGYLLFFEVAYANRVFPWVYIGNLPIDGMTYQELLQRLTRFEQEIQQGFIFTFTDTQGQKQRIAVSSEVIGYDNPISDQPLFLFDPAAFANDVFHIGRSKDIFLDISTRLSLLLSSKKALPVPIEFQHETYKELVRLGLSAFERPPQDAQLVLSLADDGKIQDIVVVPERPGYTFSLEDIHSRIEEAFSQLKTGDLPVQLQATSPRITEENTRSLVDDVSAIQGVLDQAPITLLVQGGDEEDGSWSISKEYLMHLLEFQYDEESNAVALGLNSGRLLSILEIVAEAVNVSSEEPLFQMQDEKVVAFSPGSSGRELDTAGALTLIENAILNKREKSILLPLQEIAPRTTVGSLNPIGIQELVGFATTNFAGSPKNRRHNIQVGADALNGMLIAPGKEFSLVEALGEIDGEAGYLPELVIKGSRTVPEYGGGLCQIATTLFRAVMDAGFPVLERKNHAYTVSYYFENGIPGADATIYPPHPDMKFLNDTKNALLLRAYVDGDEVVFEFWGTDDGRITTRTIPVMFNRISAPPTRYIETVDLPPGEEKCTERSHDGVSTKFEYTVTYADGNVKTQIFESTYRPWQAVCLLGAEASLSIDEEGTPQEEASPDEQILPP